MVLDKGWKACDVHVVEITAFLENCLNQLKTSSIFYKLS